MSMLLSHDCEVSTKDSDMLPKPWVDRSAALRMQMRKCCVRFDDSLFLISHTT